MQVLEYIVKKKIAAITLIQQGIGQLLLSVVRVCLCFSYMGSWTERSKSTKKLQHTNLPCAALIVVHAIVERTVAHVVGHAAGTNHRGQAPTRRIGLTWLVARSYDDVTGLPLVRETVTHFMHLLVISTPFFVRHLESWAGVCSSLVLAWTGTTTRWTGARGRRGITSGIRGLRLWESFQLILLIVCVFSTNPDTWLVYEITDPLNVVI